MILHLLQNASGYGSVGGGTGVLAAMEEDAI
jgi:hypothetical protein